jgi:hypothetical protein
VCDPQRHDVPDNRPRFAALAVLYGWIPAGDAQLIYRQTVSHLVYSVDHGHFFPGGPNWTLAGLSGFVPLSPSPIAHRPKVNPTRDRGLVVPFC